MTGLGIREAALPAWLALHGALVALHRPVSCRASPDAWTDPRPADVANTANLCLRCPVFALCNRFATANRETAGIWAGRSREPKRRRPAAPRHRRHDAGRPR